MSVTTAERPSAIDSRSWLNRLGGASLALVAGLLLFGVLGCRGSHEYSAYDAAQVQRSLQKHGLNVSVVFDRSTGAPPDGRVLGLLNLFDDVGDVTALVADTSSDGAIGGSVSAWVFDTREHADDFQAGSASRLQKGNVVVLTAPANRPVASAALDDLGVGSGSFSNAPAKPSWRCVAGICLGDRRAALDRRYGTRPADIPSRILLVPGGWVEACYWRCTNAVTEDGFTYFGGALRPANRLLTVSTCSPIAELPDGTKKGMRVPRTGKRWRGYRYVWLEGGLHGWEKVVGRGPSRTVVTLTPDIRNGTVRCVDLEQAT